MAESKKVLTLEDIMEAVKNQSENLSKEIKEAREDINTNVDKKIGEMAQTVVKLEKKIGEQDQTIQRQQTEIEELKSSHQESLKNLQIDSKKRNLIIHNLSEGEADPLELKSKIINVFKLETSIELQDWHFDNFFRIGKPDPSKIRPILVAFTSMAIKQDIEKARKSLKSVSISADMPKCILDNRKLLQPELENFRRAGHKVFFKYDKLYVDGKLWERKTESNINETTNPQQSNEKISTETKDPQQATPQQATQTQIKPKRTREEDEEQPPKNKKRSPKTTIIGSNVNHKTTPRGSKSIQKKLMESFFNNPNSNNELNQSMRSTETP